MINSYKVKSPKSKILFLKNLENLLSIFSKSGRIEIENNYGYI